MTSNEILRADVLDIVFDNRNKQYGAYLLRKNYNQRLMLALGGGLSFIFFLLLLVRNSNIKGSSVILSGEKDPVVVRTQVIPPKKIKEIIPVLPKKQDVQKAVATVKNTAYKMVNETKEVVPEQKDLSRSLISDRTVDGPLPTAVLPRSAPPGIPSGTVVEPPETKPEAPVQREPEFPGGMKAWIEYLNANLRPATDLEPGEQKTVSIRFEVAIDGSVTGFVVMKSAGASYDREVIRVLKKMPKWKPAIQNGQPVPRMFTQPVTFMGIE